MGSGLEKAAGGEDDLVALTLAALSGISCERDLPIGNQSSIEQAPTAGYFTLRCSFSYADHFRMVCAPHLGVYSLGWLREQQRVTLSLASLFYLLMGCIHMLHAQVKVCKGGL